jgi:tRNA(Ile)-lysidine synthase
VRTLKNLNLPKDVKKTANLLVGVSFGPDSMALLHRLMQESFKDLHVAHVHHGLRKESDEEMRRLEEFCKKHALSFYSKRLNTDPEGNNLEDRMRQERMRFFKEIYDEIGAEALVLGHQANEQVETGLKRLFEGAHFSSLKGMEECRELFGMRILRPQLKDWKKDLLAYLERFGIPYAIDASNLSSSYLRGRMRSEMVPFIETKFGKGCEENISFFMDKMGEWEKYLDQKIFSALEQRIEGPFGVFFPLEILEKLEPLELDHLLHKSEVKNRCTRERIAMHLVKKEFGKTITENILMCHLEKVGLFLLKKPIVFTETMPQKGDKRGWLPFWKGEIGYFPAPNGQKWILLESDKTKRKEKIFKRFSKQKIPVFLRKKLYVLEDEGKVIYEFLSL